MAKEIERKYRIADPVAFQQRMAAAHAERHQHVLQISRIFDDGPGGLRSTGQALRIRTARSLDDDAGEWSMLTFKGPREPGETKIREELELRVSDAAMMTRILDRLGYRESIRYETRRQSWFLSRCEVSLDELPRLGWFAEVEGPSVKAVEELAARLALPPESLEQSSYVTLTEREGDEVEGRRQLLFARGQR